MLAPKRIRFQNIFSNELNMIDIIMDVAMDSDNGSVDTYLNRTIVSSESYDGRYNRGYHLKYDEKFSPTFSFFKRDFGDWSIEEVRMLLKWLSGTSQPSLLECYYDDTNVVSWASIGGWVELSTQKIANNRTVAVTAKWEGLHPYCFSDLYTITKTISSPDNNKITLTIDPDEPQAAVYPRVTVKHNGSVVRITDGKVLTAVSSEMVPGTAYYNGAKYFWKELATGVFKESTTNPALTTTSVKLTNKHTDIYNNVRTLSPTIVKGSGTSETVTIDGANKIISSSSVNRIFGDNFESWRWLPLYDGKNEITVEGNCTVTLEYRVPLKVGEY